MHDIVCSSCGAHDMVPFRPRPGSAVMCRTCYSTKEQPSPKSRRSRFRSPRANQGSGGLPVAAREDNTRATWEITCSGCGAQDSVPFKPRPGSEVFCRDCHDKNKERRQLHDRYSSRRKGARGGGRAVHIPRLDHGTRVSYPVVCESCGKHETLSYVPNTSGPVLCTDCTSSKYGRRWYQVDFGSDNNRQEHPITCVECGAEDTVPFEPHPDRKYHCRGCMEGESKPNRKRLKEFKDFNQFVKVRRS
ncbi:MAG: CxxC-x17-CxxC domain-containing protein [Myxococcota bacterium]